MSTTTRREVTLLDLVRAGVSMAPDLPGLVRNAPGFLARSPKSRDSIGRVFAERAARWPERPFVMSDDGVLTYGEANRIVNRYAEVLGRRG